ncbi:MAG: hypothetical protein CBD72_05595 [Flavobacteriaceae bacterium TMED212]|jgi:hypothetical protein|nr:MAG: hypothetical protein CBD72_05595 [Flavobacteriaceae bacterium TMED212]|tara:strand:+ start:2124 stop:2333 length:210 start_codon:yes stop_codon:yes gene_type:complete
MTEIVIGLCILVAVLTITLGGVVGYLISQHVHTTNPRYTHPECFDVNGNPIPDDIIAFRFENNSDEFED